MNYNSIEKNKNAGQNDSNPRTPDINTQLQDRLKETADNARTLNEILEFHAANQLCVPLYELREIPSDEPPDDTLSRLERLMQRPKKEYWEELIGGIYRLASEKEFLVVLKDGTGMKISVRGDKDTNSLNFFKDIFHRQKIAIPDFFTKIKEDPVFELTLHRGKLEYRTDDPSLPTEEVKRLLGEDWKKAQQIILELQNIIAENQKASLEILTSSQHNNLNTEETHE